jgi:hypothetical protein
VLQKEPFFHEMCGIYFCAIWLQLLKCRGCLFNYECSGRQEVSLGKTFKFIYGLIGKEINNQLQKQKGGWRGIG